MSDPTQMFSHDSKTIPYVTKLMEELLRTTPTRLKRLYIHQIYRSLYDCRDDVTTPRLIQLYMFTYFGLV
jgi:hypothetical protein